MKSKVSPVIIIVLVVVIIAIGILIVSSVFSDGGILLTSDKEEESQIVPILELSLDTSEENQEVVTILASAKTENELGIKSIILPDGTEINAETTSYDVTENGTYTFKANGENGQTTSLSIDVANIRQISANNPYIPNGFTHVGGEVDTGYLIEDEHGNQYIWIPVEDGKLTRNTMLHSDYEETNSTASALVNSVAQNYGFYIGRFEASEYELNGEKVAATMAGKVPWTNITYLDAVEYSTKSATGFEYEGCNTAMVNSYAWDTTLEWLNKSVENYSSNTNYGNYSGTVYPTGATESDIINNICDMAGNVREWTTEIYKGATAESANKSYSTTTTETVLYRVVRGGSANLNRTANSHIGYPENTSDTYWGFRLILYK